jgi:Polyketide cyclase / dehydrase and lipid transport
MRHRRCQDWRCAWLALTAVAYLPCGHAMQVDALQTRYSEGAYQLTMTATLSAPAARVEAVLRDYASYPQLDERILTAQILSHSGPHQLELLTRINVCLAFLCRKVERVEQVEEKPGELLATVIADRSDAKRGQTHTQLRELDGNTQVTYVTEIVPKFWVPALVGRSLMLRNLREATVNLFTHIEQRAAQAPAP